jgi:hypothetical protein
MTTRADLTALYEKDFHAWASQSAELIRAGHLEQLDLEHLAEELEDMSASRQQQLESRLKVLLGHLLKWQYQPVLRGRSWQATIKEQRFSIARLLQRNPSLKSKWDETLFDAYRLGILLAVRETNLDEATFPRDCPYTQQQILSDDYWPE